MQIHSHQEFPPLLEGGRLLANTVWKGHTPEEATTDISAICLSDKHIRLISIMHVRSGFFIGETSALLISRMNARNGL